MKDGDLLLPGRLLGNNLEQMKALNDMFGGGGGVMGLARLVGVTLAGLLLMMKMRQRCRIIPIRVQKGNFR
jgi:hypothetical protein